MKLSFSVNHHTVSLAITQISKITSRNEAIEINSGENGGRVGPLCDTGRFECERYTCEIFVPPTMIRGTMLRKEPLKV